MDFGVSEMIDELKALRRGYGVESPDIGARVGVALRAVCGVADGDSPETIRRKVSTVLTLLVDELPDELRTLGRTALGLGGMAQDRYQTRVGQLAVRLQRDPRTVQRRIDEVLQRVAQLALDARPDQVSPRREIPWHTVRLEASVMLDRPVIEVLETRRIIAHQPGLAEIENSVTVTPLPNWNGFLDPADMGLDVVRGGVLDSPQLRAPNRYGFRLVLPHTLDHGEEHEFVLRTKVARPFAPHFVCTPHHPCDRFELAIRFGPGRAPARIWRLDNEFPLELLDPWPERTAVGPDAAGEVRVEFTRLELHRSYGLGWEPQPA